ncbi:MAG: hypothetical protein QOJ63_471 [Solirubrobacteraceae bacterium]|nr:hypothetical protein [Solirubrobacteraceae bacterium]
MRHYAAMRVHRTVTVAIAALALAETGTLLLSVGSSAEPTKSQQLFRKMLLDDAKTTTAIKRLLRDRGGFVDPAIQFGDLTGDGRSDALVLVDTGGAAGAVALYVFSTHGEDADSPLRVVYRSQKLYRASAEIANATLILRAPRFVEGDELCCPAKVVERVYAWSDGAGTLKQRSSRELPGPGATTTPPAQ